MKRVLTYKFMKIDICSKNEFRVYCDDIDGWYIIFTTLIDAKTYIDLI